MENDPLEESVVALFCSERFDKKHTELFVRFSLWGDIVMSRQPTNGRTDERTGWTTTTTDDAPRGRHKVTKNRQLVRRDAF